MRSEIDLGTTRIRACLAELQNPERAYPVVHVAGSNGKGTVCAFISKTLRKLGVDGDKEYELIRVGQFNSPHLIHPRDCIRVNGCAIPQPTYDRLHSAIKQNSQDLTSFEILTVVALTYFKESAVDIAVVEVGLGGLLDATNVFEPSQKLIGIVTALTLEHTAFLGKTITDIARHKVGIAQLGSLLLAGEQEVEFRDEVERVVKEYCKEVGSQIVLMTDGNPRSVDTGLDNHIKRFLVETMTLFDGEIQRQNAKLAIVALACLNHLALYTSCIPTSFSRVSRALKSLTPSLIERDLSETKWPGRMTTLQISGKSFFVDGAHTLASVVALRRYMDTHPFRFKVKRRFLFALTAGKDVQHLLRALLREEQDELWCLGFSVPQDMEWIRCERTSSLAKHAGTMLSQEQIREFPSIKEAMSALQEETGEVVNVQEETGEVVNVVCGSLYLVGDLYRTFVTTEPIEI